MNNKNFRYGEDPFAKNGYGIAEIYHKVSMLIRLLHSKPQVKNMKNKYYDLYYTVIKRKQIVNDKY